MANDTLQDLYLEQIQDLFSACAQSRGMTQRLAEAAAADDLRQALLDGVEGIERGRDTLAQLAERHGADPHGDHCKGMEGLVAEAASDVFETEFTDNAVRDAAIIAQYQRMAHYAIAGYGTVRDFAVRLGLDEDRQQVETCLQKSYDGDRRMTEIAATHVNLDAA